jgi:hypothetical protein
MLREQFGKKKCNFCKILAKVENFLCSQNHTALFLKKLAPQLPFKKLPDISHLDFEIAL